MMTSSNGSIFRVTGHLCGEFIGPRWIPTQRPVTRSFDVFFDLRLNKRLSIQSWGWWFDSDSDSDRGVFNIKLHTKVLHQVYIAKQYEHIEQIRTWQEQKYLLGTSTKIIADRFRRGHPGTLSCPLSFETLSCPLWRHSNEKCSIDILCGTSLTPRVSWKIIFLLDNWCLFRGFVCSTILKQSCYLFCTKLLFCQYCF